MTIPGTTSNKNPGTSHLWRLFTYLYNKQQRITPCQCPWIPGLSVHDFHLFSCGLGGRASGFFKARLKPPGGIRGDPWIRSDTVSHAQFDKLTDLVVFYNDCHCKCVCYQDQMHPDS